MKIKSRIRRALDMKFSDPKMQEEFTVLKEQNSARDFNATVIFLITMNLLIIFPGIAKDDHTNTIVAAVIIGVIVVVCGIRRFFSRHVQYFTLLALFFFNLSRFVIIGLSYDTYSKIGMYIQGYMFGALQCVVLTRINNLYHKIIFIAISLGLRYGILIGILDPARYSTMTLLRQFVVDSFIIFMFYSDDSTERKIFQNFFENRDELTKFKELLTDSFPQSVTVIDSTTQKTLFANNAFMTTFNNYSGEQSPAIVETGTLSSRQMNTNGRMKTDPTENYLKHLHIDLNTLRDLETLRSDFDTFMSNSNNYVTLEELLNKLVQHNLLNYSIMSMAASCSDPGKSRTFDVVLKKIKWDRVDAIAIILNDITYQENLIALKLANANKDKLIATVSHELRTPLHGIIGLLEISQTKVQDKEVQLHLSLCKDNAMLLHSLVNSMLDLQQLSTGKLRLNIGKVSMKKVLNDVTQLFKFQCSEKKIELKVVVSENVPECITSDENRLKQVLINLIGNAIKFTFKGGITIEANQDPEDPKQLEVSVTDTGIGIRDDDKHKLFKMYGKLDDAEGVNKNGIGLGLTISSTLASLLNGRSSDKGIELASKYGEGSKFSFKVHKDLESLKSISSDQNLDRLVGGKKEDEDSKVRKNSSGLNLIHEHKLEESVTGGEMNEDTGSMVRLEEKLASYSHFPQKETMRDLKRKLTNSRQSPSRIDHFSIAIDDKSIMTTSAVAKRPSFSKQPSQEPLNLNQSEAEPNGEKMDINNHTFLKLKSLNENECILVVDDNPFNLLVAKNLIKELGYNVKAATGGPEAIEAVKTSIKDGETIKVIFMDCQMPIMDGFETTRSLKKMMENDEIPAIPILAWTANNGEEDVRRCYECGMSGYLMKPTTQAAILKAISQ